jgi:Predicted nuclease of the RecB family
VRGILVAPGINKSARKLLNDSGLEFKRVDPERCVKLVEELKPMLERVQKIVS